jgi:hypothetical protein
MITQLLRKLKKLKKKIAGKYRGDPDMDSIPETRQGNDESKKQDG